MKKVCQECKKEYEPRSKKQVYCSRKCSTTAINRKRILGFYDNVGRTPYGAEDINDFIDSDYDDLS